EERGYPKGEEPDKTKTEDKPKDKDKAKAKSEDKPKTEEKPKSDDDPEKDAARKLKLAKRLIDEGQVEGGKDELEAIVKKYPKTKAGEEAKELLEKLKK